MVKTIKLGSMNIEIEEVEGLYLGDRKLDGLFEEHRGVISLERINSPYAKRHTLWHELIHVVCTRAGILNEEEVLVNAIAYGIMDILEANPDMRQLGKEKNGRDSKTVSS